MSCLNLNKVVLAGRLTGDPELKQTQSGIAVVSFRIAVNRRFVSRDAQQQNEGRDMKRYAQYMRDQVTELLTNYGKIDIIWFDYSFINRFVSINRNIPTITYFNSTFNSTIL